MSRPWHMFLAERIERCCSCDRQIQIGELVIDDGTCVLCVRCSGPVLATIEVHGEESAA